MSWLPPFGFACTVHALEAKEGGKHRMSFRNFTTSNSHAFGGTYLKLGPGATLDYTDTFDDPNLSGEMKVTVSLIDPIVALAGPEVYGSSIAASRRDKFIDDMPGTILRCAAAWRPGAVPGPMSEPVRAAKVSRSDPCPCGSGKKYKKCCGGGGATSSMH